ncbi:hypothetical protein Salat_2575100 [Sesamum alatum]|uniref:Endonuclease/exonuclease/phosphatase domain-containing protein n=1 Tax=Sesamum alatum TaxID=300844 RepID=A0AAE1XTV8_9LAMI|nr:hypothetical protein Salat_2575100 [Sesamum alatum]
MRELLEVRLDDLEFQGLDFTWSNRRQSPDTVWSRLDRALGNLACCGLIPEHEVFHIPSAYSDHCYLNIQLERPMPSGNIGWSQQQLGVFVNVFPGWSVELGSWKDVSRLLLSARN